MRPNVCKFTKAMGRVMWRLLITTIHGRPSISVSDKTLAKRIVACQVGCDRYLPETQQCGVCTCYIKLKAPLATESCPHPEKDHWK